MLSGFRFWLYLIASLCLPIVDKFVSGAIVLPFTILTSVVILADTFRPIAFNHDVEIFPSLPLYLHVQHTDSSPVLEEEDL
jgi:hypothetical protein